MRIYFKITDLGQEIIGYRRLHTEFCREYPYIQVSSQLDFENNNGLEELESHLKQDTSSDEEQDDNELSEKLSFQMAWDILQ